MTALNKDIVYDMIIVGGGPGGYTSALYAARAGFNVLVLEKFSAGGQMALTHQIDNYPGFEDGIDGFIDCDGVFVSVGRKPATDFFGSQLDLDENGYIIADETTKTSIPGVYAVGDIRTKQLRQVVTAVSDGAMAVHSAEEYLAEEHKGSEI